LTSALPDARHQVTSYADVGCGSGDAVRSVTHGLRERGFQLRSAKGFDVSPHVARLAAEGGVEFANVDFAAAGGYRSRDAVHVVEHADPIGFIRALPGAARFWAARAARQSLNAAARDLFRGKVTDPASGVSRRRGGAQPSGVRGLRVVDYTYTLGFQAPSGRATAPRGS
jgi:hypothetical protein